ncbi:MAG: protease inhibitor I42 family protein [Tepidisphaeraceae bacterium]
MIREMTLIGGWFAFACALAVLGGCNNYHVQPDSAASKVIAVAGEQNATDSVTLSIGQFSRVRLQQQTGTGYSWSLASPIDPAAPVKLEATWTDSDKSTPGALATQVFDIRALDMGQTTVRFVYTRPWETNTPPARTFTLNVTVVK